jgi:hypothetical protein
MQNSEYISTFCLDGVSQTEDLCFGCSSTCSAASTVISALSSMEASTSFPPVSSAMSFDLANRVFVQFTGGRDQAPACTRPWDTQGAMNARPLDNHQRYPHRLHPYERQTEKPPSALASGRGIDWCVICAVDTRPFQAEQSSLFEEYSLGSGNPWDSGDKK